MNILVLDPKTVCVEKSEVYQAEQLDKLGMEVLPAKLPFLTYRVVQLDIPHFFLHILFLDLKLEYSLITILNNKSKVEVSYVLVVLLQ